MRFTRQLILGLTALLALAAAAQGNAPAQAEQPQAEWYLNDVVHDVFVLHSGFEYYYTPSASDMESMRRKGEVSYMLNTPAGYTVKKTRETIDRLMASYDDIIAVGDWYQGDGNYWREFRFDRNKFRFSVGRKAVEEGGVYFVSVTESANYYKTLGKKGKEKDESVDDDGSADKDGKRTTKRAARSRKAAKDEIQATGNDAALDAEEDNADEGDDVEQAPAVSEKERARAARESQKAREREQKALKREQEKKAKAEEKARKAQEKKQRQEEERIKKAEEKRLREAERQEKAAAKRERAKQDKKAAAAAASKYHYTDVALWLSEKYGFTQVSDNGSGTVMYSTAVTDADMAKLAIKNALKGSDARMAMPWRVNGQNGAVETGYTVDGHVLVFAIGSDEAGHVTLTVTEVSGEDFELFRSARAAE